jgi:hypothetical protein
MARTVKTPTSAYVLLSGTTFILTVKKAGAGVLYLNDVNTDDLAAEQISAETPGAREGLQFKQGLIKNTYFRASGSGWILVLEED